jgi:hypothetical protein
MSRSTRHNPTELVFGQPWSDVFEISERKSVNKTKRRKPWRQAASHVCKNEGESRGKKEKKKEWVY